MFTCVPSLESILQCLQPAFTQPSFATQAAVFLGWVMCLGRRAEFGVFETIEAATPVSHAERHPFDRFYNFFSRSCWTVRELAHEVAVAIVLGLNRTGVLYLVVDDTLLHKRGQHVYGLGWFRDAVASTAKRSGISIQRLSPAYQKLFAETYGFCCQRALKSLVTGLKTQHGFLLPTHRCFPWPLAKRCCPKDKDASFYTSPPCEKRSICFRNRNELASAETAGVNDAVNLVASPFP